MATDRTYTLPTSHAEIYIRDSIPAGDHTGPTLLLIHGNSSCSRVFEPLFAQPCLSKHYRLVAFDLPGHGQSSNASAPEKSYTQPAYAQLACELLGILGVREVVVFGWSLGGHIAIEMLPLLPSGIRGIMITGTPPVGPGEIPIGFRLGDEPLESPPTKELLTEDEMVNMARMGVDPPFEDWMLDAVRRTDGRARSIMFLAFYEHIKVVSQRGLVEETAVPVAVVNGKEEPYVNLEFVRGIRYGNLWGGECVEMEGCLHAPFWAKPEEFAGTLSRFVNDVWALQCQGIRQENLC